MAAKFGLFLCTIFMLINSAEAHATEFPGKNRQWNWQTGWSLGASTVTAHVQNFGNSKCNIGGYAIKASSDSFELLYSLRCFDPKTGMLQYGIADDLIFDIQGNKILSKGGDTGPAGAFLGTIAFSQGGFNLSLNFSATNGIQLKRELSGTLNSGTLESGTIRVIDKWRSVYTDGSARETTMNAELTAVSEVK